MNYQQKFEFYKITHALVYKKDNQLYKNLSNDDNYTLLYDDEYYALFKKEKNINYVNITLTQN